LGTILLTAASSQGTDVCLHFTSGFIYDCLFQNRCPDFCAIWKAISL